MEFLPDDIIKGSKMYFVLFNTCSKYRSMVDEKVLLWLRDTFAWRNAYFRNKRLLTFCDEAITVAVNGQVVPDCLGPIQDCFTHLLMYAESAHYEVVKWLVEDVGTIMSGFWLRNPKFDSRTKDWLVSKGCANRETIYSADGKVIRDYYKV
eukprot:7380248-Prymnesium_polylepis.1